MELLSQIMEEVGGSHLRRNNGSARLCVSRRWYAAARPVYLSGLGTTSIKVFGHNLRELDTKYGDSGLRPLMHKNTRSLRVRLLGHYWDANSSQAYDTEEEVEDEQSNGEGAAAAPTPLNEPPFEFEEPEHMRTLEDWRDTKLRSRLDDLFTDLRHFEALQDLIFEASADPEVGHERGPHWDYLYQSTLLNFVINLPVTYDLRNLTLDVSGLRNGPLGNESHLCSSIAKILPRIENVRLRMHNLCNDVFKMEDLRPEEIKIKTLIIKLQLPTFLYTDEPRVLPCQEMRGPRTSQALLQILVRNSGTFLTKLATLRRSESHGMTGFRISFAYPQTPSISTVDCLTMKIQNLPEEHFLYEDDGKPNWYELSQAHRMLNGGDFRFTGRV